MAYQGRYYPKDGVVPDYHTGMEWCDHPSWTEILMVKNIVLRKRQLYLRHFIYLSDKRYTLTSQTVLPTMITHSKWLLVSFRFISVQCSTFFPSIFFAYTPIHSVLLHKSTQKSNRAQLMYVLTIEEQFYHMVLGWIDIWKIPVIPWKLVVC